MSSMPTRTFWAGWCGRDSCAESFQLQKPRVSKLLRVVGNRGGETEEPFQARVRTVSAVDLCFGEKSRVCVGKYLRMFQV